MIQARWIDLQLTWRVFVNLILKTKTLYWFLGTFVFTLFALQWLFNIDQLIEIVLGDSGLTFWDRLDFLFDGFINIFRFANDFVPIMIISIAAMQAVAIVLLVRYRGGKKASAAQSLPIGLSFLGVGCVACGGSVLTPVLGLIATNVSISFAESLSNALLLIALVLSYISMTKAAFQAAQKA